MSTPSTYGQLVIRGAKSTAQRLPFALCLILMVMILLNLSKGIGAEETILRAFKATTLGLNSLSITLPLLLWIVVAAFVDIFVGATVWYYRERNPRYIAKMERIEQERQEKADALKAEKKTLPADE